MATVTTSDLRILIVEARFYEDIADALVDGAMGVLEAAGAQVERLAVPGAFEIPAAIRFALDSGRYDGFVALGCVIRGDTTHYDYVCGESARGLNQLAIDRKACIGYGILTVENREQAWARARADRANKGADVASACLRMIEIKRQFQQG
ncbi:MAG: 6,7-dimethyl-8-ribityllumazine synthase [Tistrella sp.]|uniref:6,7-dimethyl-8-ribityllumazine synthase n=1 Tax=Tistrella mobilis TaxID=171437 RepID=A0A3B9IP94_9PROT|nr:6,7-dimethyl-8-ribityllumazine synthase [Tistrella sp.]MAD35708.1 6,7-dimethyl-8-ribityllumazine synthase [Tistrella sp.]MBA79396.1 6,7-dimethyl-8-ribityllumazine synthase [Tistrella sp.]HAE49671.1 6,7-dimethyl-8-ribityllumazine synthase [Tistrella mobilis]|tara:strand:+ start:197 stop:646 length:450 start_codon:yes stop_codon:yes gene_type:complete